MSDKHLRYCVDCGVEFRVKTIPNQKIRCNDCQGLRTKMLKRRRNKEYCELRKKFGSVLEVRHCVGCGAEFKIKRTQAMKHRCDACQEIRNEKNRIKYRVAKRKEKLGVSYYLRRCIDCGVLIKVSQRGGRAKVRCTACQREANKKYQRERKRESRCARRQQEIVDDTCSDRSAPERKYDCKHYRQCMSPPDGKLFKNSRACVKCKNYQSVDNYIVHEMEEIC